GPGGDRARRPVGRAGRRRGGGARARAVGQQRSGWTRRGSRADRSGFARAGTLELGAGLVSGSRSAERGSMNGYGPLLAALIALLAGLAIGKAWERYKLRDGQWIDRRRARESPHY